MCRIALQASHDVDEAHAPPVDDRPLCRDDAGGYPLHDTLGYHDLSHHCCAAVMHVVVHCAMPLVTMPLVTIAVPRWCRWLPTARYLAHPAVQAPDPAPQ